MKYTLKAQTNTENSDFAKGEKREESRVPWGCEKW